MKVLRDLQDPDIERQCILTFGVFDGLHLGHQSIIDKVVERSRAGGRPSTVVTFDPHPRAVLHPQDAPQFLQTFDQKMRGLETSGIDQVIVLEFTTALSLITAEQFLVDIIFGRLDAREVYVGRGSTFGHRRQGHFDLLDRVARRFGRIAAEVPEAKLRGRRISSSMVRRLVSSGRMGVARRMLGRPYEIEGPVVEGRKLGKSKLNYATANVLPAGFVTPATGVYVTTTCIENQWRRSVTNVGHRPTVGGDPDVTIETHVVDFDQDIYRRQIQVQFLHRLRGEVKFESIEALRDQISKDYRRTLRYFDSSPVRRCLEFI
jgi:riboflavin kinase/FMN adenylyltransferase